METVSKGRESLHPVTAYQIDSVDYQKKYKKMVNGTYYVVEAIPESKHKKFWVVGAYMNADSGTQAPNAQNPGNTPNASLASSLSANNNIAAMEQIVNKWHNLEGNFEYCKCFKW